MSFLFITLPAAVIPALVLVWYFVKSDKYPEPVSMILKTFFYGILIVIPILFFAGLAEAFGGGIKGNMVLEPLFNAFALAAIPEEFFKFLVLSNICAKSPEFDEPMDGIVYGAVASLGFATLENILYVSSGGLGVAIARAFTAVPGHASFGAIMGYYYAKSHFKGEKVGFTHKALLVPILLHGLYDFFLFFFVGIANKYPEEVEPSGVDTLLILGSVVMFFVVFVHTIRRARRYHAEMKVEQQSLSHDH